MTAENITGTDIVGLVEKAIVDGDQASIERMVNRSRWGMEVESTVSVNGEGPSAEGVAPQSKVMDEIRHGEHVTVFKPGVDFRKGGSIHF